MNFVHLSPHFPPNYRLFSRRLRELGVTVLGLADEPWDRLGDDLRGSLADYYQVADLNDYDQLLRALGHFTHRHGKLDRLDSHNEHWLETEAWLRTDFNIPGIKTDQVEVIKRKSMMKERFRAAGLTVAPGILMRDDAQGRAFVKEVGYPVVAKPDIGVGAGRMYRLASDADLAAFLRDRPPTEYFLEAFVHGRIQTFDGLTDRDGNIVFCSSLEYSQGIMETVNDDNDVHYYTLRDIPADLEAAGRATARAFDVRERFFHFEYFRTADDRLVALEVNIRPPGGLTTDMFNYANDFDIYREWANVVVNNRFEASWSRPYHCCYVGRKSHKRYARSHAEVLARHGAAIVHHEPISGVFSAALGDYGYLVRSPDLAEISAIAEFIRQKA